MGLEQGKTYEVISSATNILLSARVATQDRGASESNGGRHTVKVSSKWPGEFSDRCSGRLERQSS